MKVILFEPNINERGHSKQWCWNLYKFLNNDFVNKVIFTDTGDILKRNYSGNSQLEIPFEIINIHDFRSPLINSRGINRLKQERELRNWYKEVTNKITNIQGDLLIVTSQDYHYLYKYISKINIDKIFITHNVSFIPVLHKERFSKRSFLSKINGRIISKKIYKIIKNNKLIVLEKTTEKYLKENGLDKVYSLPYFSYDKKDIEKSPKKEFIKNNRFILVGTIYQGKNFEFPLNAFDNMKPKNIDLLYAGRPSGEYGERIKERIIKQKKLGITGTFKYLSDEEFNDEILKSKFVIIPYSKTRWDQTSGIMFNALFNYRPIIVPDILPFKNYLKEYNLGLSYKENDYTSFINTLYKAIETPIDSFLEGIKKFKLDNTTDKIRGKFKKIILE